MVVCQAVYEYNRTNQNNGCGRKGVVEYGRFSADWECDGTLHVWPERDGPAQSGTDIPVPGTVRVEDDPAFGPGEHRALARIADVLLWGVLVGLFFRMFSKNLPRRRAENQKWVNWWWRVRSSSSGARARHADKEHKYFTCKQCKTICRVPVGKGKIIITCPKCGAQIHAKS